MNRNLKMIVVALIGAAVLFALGAKPAAAVLVSIPCLGAYAYLTALDLAKINGSDLTVGLIEENLNAAPELERLPASTRAGTAFKTLVRTAYPTTGFRQLNQGVEPTKSTYVNKTFEMFYYDGQMEVDNAIAEGDEQGIDHALNMEADGHGRAFLLTAGKQVWYGRTSSGDANGFPGAVEVVDSSLVQDAQGSTSSVQSSVYAVVAGPKFMEILFGKNMVMTAGAWRKQSITRSSKEMTAWKNALEGFVGCAWYSKYAVGRIKNLNGDTDNKGLTDSLLAKLIAKFPVGVRPSFLFMSRRSRRELQVSRSVTLIGNANGGSAIIAPTPTEYEGIPIVATDSVIDTEAVA